jgi:lipopolysaccharide transport system ATP-binding protein
MSDNLIRFENVSKKYHLGISRTSLPGLLHQMVRGFGGQKYSSNGQNKILWALRDISFSLKQGESLALIGSNGAGKTTILKLLSNVTTPTLGTIRTQGKLSALIELGAGFHPDLTGRENVYLNGTILGLKRKEIETRFDEIVDFSEIERFIDTPVKRYSSGMVVRLGFAVAACIEPDILLVDEVLAVGDASFQQKCFSRINSLIAKGTSLIFVSHNLYMVQAVCQTALYLKQGKMKFMGEIKEVIDLYEQDLHQIRKLRFNDSSQDIEESGSSELEITKVEVLDEEGISRNDYLNSGVMQIQIHYNALVPMGQVQVSVFIRRSDGLTCCMMRTKLDHYELLIEAGQGIVTLYLEPLQLVTGTYFAEAWFLNKNDSMAIVSRGGRSDWFSVKGNALSYADDSGIFEPNTKWGHKQILDDEQLIKNLSISKGDVEEII